MTPEPGNARVVRLVDAAAIGVFAMHAAFRLSLRGGDDSWGANLSAHLLVPMSAAFWLVARAMERRHEEIARAVAGEDSTCPICAMRSRCKPDQ